MGVYTISKYVHVSMRVGYTFKCILGRSDQKWTDILKESLVLIAFRDFQGNKLI